MAKKKKESINISDLIFKANSNVKSLFCIDGNYFYTLYQAIAHKRRKALKDDVKEIKR